MQSDMVVVIRKTGMVAVRSHQVRVLAVSKIAINVIFTVVVCVNGVQALACCVQPPLADHCVQDLFTHDMTLKLRCSSMMMFALIITTAAERLSS